MVKNEKGEPSFWSAHAREKITGIPPLGWYKSQAHLVCRNLVHDNCLATDWRDFRAKLEMETIHLGHKLSSSPSGAKPSFLSWYYERIEYEEMKETHFVGFQHNMGFEDLILINYFFFGKWGENIIFIFLLTYNRGH